MAIIYKATNLKNQKVYIGQTIYSLDKRIKNHITEARNEKKPTPFHAAILKYGIDSFKVEIIETVEAEELNEREIYWIDYYDSYYNGYNATLGGQQGKKYTLNDCLPYWNQGLTIQEISKLTKINASTISNLLVSEGKITEEEIKKRKYEAISKKNSKYPKEMYLFYWEKGYSLKEISDRLEVGIPCISRHLREQGITSTELRQRATFKNGNRQGISCALVDENNNIIQCFQSYHEAARETQASKDASAIRLVCEGYLNSINGFVFRKLDQNEKIIIPENITRKRKIAIYGIKIGEPDNIVFYDSISEAARQEGADRSSLSKCINGSSKYSRVKDRVWRRQGTVLTDYEFKHLVMR